MIYMSNWNDTRDIEFNLNWINCTKHLSFNMLYLGGLVKLFMNVDDDSKPNTEVYHDCQEYINSLDDRV